jgi:hypothetical protein
MMEQISVTGELTTARDGAPKRNPQDTHCPAVYRLLGSLAVCNLMSEFK